MYITKELKSKYEKKNQNLQAIRKTTSKNNPIKSCSKIIIVHVLNLFKLLMNNFFE